MDSHDEPTADPEREQFDRDVTESDQDTSGGMGVSSEIEGHTGPGQHATTGVKDTSTAREATL